MSDIEKCETCKVFQWLNDNHGYCRRYAPRPRFLGTAEDEEADDHTWWPTVFIDDSCGEWTPNASVEAFRVRVQSALP